MNARSTITPGRALGEVLLLFLVFGLAYSLIVPPFEAPDEPYHAAFARHLAQGGSLPVQAEESTGPWEQEGSQPPLYYAMVGWLTRSIDQGDFSALATRNPRANIGDPLFPGNKNFMLYSGASHPLSGANLALHVGRWLSLLLGLLTVLCTGLTARYVFPQRKWLAALAALWVAVIPQYAFLSGSLTNDAAVTAFSALGVLWMARLAVREKNEAVQWWEWSILGVIVAGATLSKLQGVGLGLLAGAVVVALAWQRRDGRFFLRALIALVLPAVLLAGWWFVRNIVFYGDWSGVGHLLTLNGRRTARMELGDWWLEFRGLRYSFWGLFGWFNILLPSWVYSALDIVTLAAMGGVIFGAVRGIRRRRTRGERSLGPTGRVLLLCATWASLSFALLIYWTLQATGSQGRLLFPALSALAILLVFGLDSWIRLLPMRARGWVWAAPFALLAGASIYALSVLLPAAYRPAPPVSEIPAIATPVQLTYGDGERVEMLAVTTPERRFHPGDSVPVTLYMRAPSTMTTDLTLFLQLLDEDGAEIANVTTHPGWGRNPTSLWQPGSIQKDDYLLWIKRTVDNRSPLAARLYVGFVDPATEGNGYRPLPARTASGETVNPFVGHVIVEANQPASLEPGAQPIGATFGDVIRIDEAAYPSAPLAAGDTFTVTLLYEALGSPATDYTAFVHVLDASGAQVAGFDVEPAEGRFPTSLWRAGDRIRTEFPLTLPADIAPGDLKIWTGLYESGSGGAVRLPVTDAAGMDSGDGVIQTGALRVE